MYKPFPVISIEGDAHECGAQHGAKAADRVAKTIEFYLPSFVKQAKLTLDEVRERARGYGAQIESIDLPPEGKRRNQRKEDMPASAQAMQQD